MRRLILSVSLLITGLITMSQSNWIVKELDNNLKVKFPNVPVYKVSGKAGTYTSKTTHNLFQVIVQYDVVPNYTEFVKLNKGDQARIIEVFLNNAIKGMLLSSGNENQPISTIQIGDLQGRKATYNSINPIIGEKTKVQVRMYYGYNKIIVFRCQQMQSEALSAGEVNTFFSSITL